AGQAESGEEINNLLLDLSRLRDHQLISEDSDRSRTAALSPGRRRDNTREKTDKPIERRLIAAGPLHRFRQIADLIGPRDNEFLRLGVAGDLQHVVVNFEEVQLVVS